MGLLPFSPTSYNKIVKPLPEIRADTVRLASEAAAQHLRAYVLVNNRSEGCAPLAVQALVDAPARSQAN